MHRSERKTDELVASSHQLRDFTHRFIMDSHLWFLFVYEKSRQYRVVLVSLIANLTHLVLLGKREPQLKNCLNQIDLWPYLLS